MGTHSLRGQVLLEVLLTTVFFVTLSGYVWTNLDSHQKRLRNKYHNHEVKYEFQDSLGKVKEKLARSKKAYLDSRNSGADGNNNDNVPKKRRRSSKKRSKRIRKS